MAPARAALIAAAALALAGAPLGADRFDDALASAQANLAAPGGRDHAARVSARFDEAKLRDALAGCREPAREDDRVPFTVLMELRGDGRAAQVLLRPPTPVAVCLRWVIRETAFPKPPSAGYWVAVPVDPSRAPGAPVIPTPGAIPARAPAPPTTPSERVVDFGGGGVRAVAVDPARLPELAALRRELTQSRAEMLGPVLAQSNGLSPDDPKLAPYWALASELSLPVGVPMGPLPAGGAAPQGHRVRLGDPLLLESVLVRHPGLRVNLMGAGWPFLEATLGMLARYPGLFVDTGVAALPRSEFHGLLRRLVDAGFGDRILFSSGPGGSPRERAQALEAVRAADFLTAEQRRMILSENAARFLRPDAGAAR